MTRESLPATAVIKPALPANTRIGFGALAQVDA